MTIIERKLKESQAATLKSYIDRDYKSEVSQSVFDRYGDSINHVSSWELEAMLDDLISIANDH
ncbi:MAG: hypothetical protein ACI4JM_00735 [Oscillospiraceae bacterium]